MTIPYARSMDTQNCIGIGPASVCHSGDGYSASVSLFHEGPVVSVRRNNEGQWDVGIGAEGTTPTFGAGLTGGATQYLRSGDSEVCAGPFAGVPNVVTVSPQACVTTNHERAEEWRQLQREMPEIQRRQLEAQQARYYQDQLQAMQARWAREDLERSINNMGTGGAYNVPADMARPGSVGSPSPSPSSAAETPARSQQLVMVDTPRSQAPANGAVSNASNQTGMTQQQFQQEMQQQAQRFQQADAANRANPLNIRVPEGNQTPPIGDVPPAGVRPQTQYSTYAPRNGYDEYGNRADSTRRQYDENGNYAVPQRPYSTAIDNSPSDFWQSQPQQPQAQPQRQNRVYSTDGSSRPIGRQSNAANQFQAIYNQSQAQIAQIQANRNTGGISNAPSVSSQADFRAPAPPASLAPAGSGSSQGQQLVMNENARTSFTPRIVFDDNAPRGGNYAYLQNDGRIVDGRGQVVGTGPATTAQNPHPLANSNASTQQNTQPAAGTNRLVNNEASTQRANTTGGTQPTAAPTTPTTPSPAPSVNTRPAGQPAASAGVTARQNGQSAPTASLTPNTSAAVTPRQNGQSAATAAIHF